MNRWLLLALVAGCTGGKSAKDPVVEPQPGSDSMAQQMKPGAPKPSVAWTQGPAISSSEGDLVAGIGDEADKGRDILDVGLLEKPHTGLDAVWDVSAGQLKLQFDRMIMRAVHDGDVFEVGAFFAKL